MAEFLMRPVEHRPSTPKRLRRSTAMWPCLWPTLKPPPKKPSRSTLDGKESSMSYGPLSWALRAIQRYTRRDHDSNNRPTVYIYIYVYTYVYIYMYTHTRIRYKELQAKPPVFAGNIVAGCQDLMLGQKPASSSGPVILKGGSVAYVCLSWFPTPIRLPFQLKQYLLFSPGVTQPPSAPSFKPFTNIFYRDPKSSLCFWDADVRASFFADSS